MHKELISFIKDCWTNPTKFKIILTYLVSVGVLNLTLDIFDKLKSIKEDYAVVTLAIGFYIVILTFASIGVVIATTGSYLFKLFKK